MSEKTELLESTVNVVEYQKGMITKLFAFSSDEDGEDRATTVFREMATGAGADEEDLDLCIAEAIYEQGDYQLFIVRSE